jgi:hypothetical protein
VSRCVTTRKINRNVTCSIAGNFWQRLFVWGRLNRSRQQKTGLPPCGCDITDRTGRCTGNGFESSSVKSYLHKAVGRQMVHHTHTQNRKPQFSACEPHKRRRAGQTTLARRGAKQWRHDA